MSSAQATTAIEKIKGKGAKLVEIKVQLKFWGAWTKETDLADANKITPLLMRPANKDGDSLDVWQTAYIVFMNSPQRKAMYDQMQCVAPDPTLLRPTSLPVPMNQQELEEMCKDAMTVTDKQARESRSTLHNKLADGDKPKKARKRKPAPDAMSSANTKKAKTAPQAAPKQKSKQTAQKHTGRKVKPRNLEVQEAPRDKEGKVR